MRGGNQRRCVPQLYTGLLCIALALYAIANLFSVNNQDTAAAASPHLFFSAQRHCIGSPLLPAGEKYMLYSPHSGFSNQVGELKNALLVAAVLNRTLVLPPIFDHHAVALGSCPKFRVHEPHEMRALAWAHISDLIRHGRIDQIKAVWSRGWDWFHRPIHAVAHLLHPLWRNEEQFEDEELEDGFMAYIRRQTRGDVHMLKCIENDLLAFRNETGGFGRETAQLRETQLQPVSWWEKYGNCAPTLKRIAIRVLSQDCSSGPCERNWSTWALFHTKKRNRLSTAQLERLVFCHCNLQLLEKNSVHPEPSQVNVDKIDIEKVKFIPEIPQDERDMYSLLYEELTAPSHNTRGTTRSGRQTVAGASDAIATTSAQPHLQAPPVSSSDADTQESEGDDVSLDDLDE